MADFAANGSTIRSRGVAYITFSGRPPVGLPTHHPEVMRCHGSPSPVVSRERTRLRKARREVTQPVDQGGLSGNNSRLAHARRAPSKWLALTRSARFDLPRGSPEGSLKLCGLQTDKGVGSK